MNVTPTGDSQHTQNIQIKPWKSFATAWLCWSEVKVIQLCLTFCDPRYCNLPGSSVHADSPGKNPGVGCHSLLLGIFPTQGSNPDLPHCRQVLHHLSHQGSPGCTLGTFANTSNKNLWNEMPALLFPSIGDILQWPLVKNFNRKLLI